MRNADVHYDGENWSPRTNNYRVRSVTPAHQECWAVYVEEGKNNEGPTFSLRPEKVQFWALVEEVHPTDDEGSETEIAQRIVGVSSDVFGGLSIDYYEKYDPYSYGSKFPVGYTSDPTDLDRFLDSAHTEWLSAEKRRERDRKEMESIWAEANQKFGTGCTGQQDRNRSAFIKQEMRKAGISRTPPAR